MENKKLLVLLLLLGGGYLIWKNSNKMAAPTATDNGTGSGPTGGSGEYGSELPSESSEYGPQSQKDCPEGYTFVPIQCITAPCYGGSCVKAEPKPQPIDLEPLPPVKNPDLQPIAIDKQLVYGEVSGFSFTGSDKNTLALQGNIKEGLVKQGNFN